VNVKIFSTTNTTTQNSQVVETYSQKIGFRRIELVQDPLQNADQYGKGTTFYFRVNGVPIFAGG
jgi:beta-mannosidase